MRASHQSVTGFLEAVETPLSYRPQKKGILIMADTVSDADFEAVVLKSDKPVLVDFFAEWCGPCKAMAPALDEVAAALKDSVKVVKVDVDQSPGIAQKYNVRAMPTLLLFSGGEVAAQHVGAMTQRASLEKWLTSSIA